MRKKPEGMPNIGGLEEVRSKPVGPEAECEHPDDDTLERYCLGGLKGAALATVEKHVLVCESCRRRADSNKRFIQAMRAAATEIVSVPLNFTHDTDDGLIHLFVRPADGGGWVATSERIGPFETVEEANAYLLRSFRRAYPKHLCADCETGRPRGPRPRRSL